MIATRFLDLLLYPTWHAWAAAAWAQEPCSEGAGRTCFRAVRPWTGPGWLSCGRPAA